MASFDSFALPVLSGIAGGLLNRSRTDTEGPSGSGLQLYNTLSNYYSQAMKNTPDFMRGYETSGLNAIKSGADINSGAINNSNSSHGVRGPAAAYSSMVPRVAAQGQVAQLQTSLPLVRSQYQQGIMDKAAQGVQIGPHQKTLSGNVMGGIFGNLASTLAGMYGMNQLTNAMKGMGGSPSIGGFPSTMSGGGSNNLGVGPDGYYINPGTASSNLNFDSGSMEGGYEGGGYPGSPELPGQGSGEGYYDGGGN